VTIISSTFNRRLAERNAGKSKAIQLCVYNGEEMEQNSITSNQMDNHVGDIVGISPLPGERKSNTATLVA
jgi:hypothetical protein